MESAKSLDTTAPNTNTDQPLQDWFLEYCMTRNTEQEIFVMTCICDKREIADSEKNVCVQIVESLCCKDAVL